jgi:hypothetical protein
MHKVSGGVPFVTSGERKTWPRINTRIFADQSSIGANP